MRPTSDTALQRPDLGQAVYETLQAAPTMGYIGLEVMPIFRVMESAAEYPVIPKEALFNLLDTKRGPLGHYNRSEDEFESGYFRTAENGLERRIDERYAKIYGSKFAYELTIANILMQDILRAQEARVAGKIFNATNFSAHTVTTVWSNIASLPKNDVETGKTTLRASGIIPNCLILNWTAFQNLKLNTAVQAQVYQLFPDAAKTGMVSIEHLRTYFDVERVLVAGSLYNSAKKNQNAVLSDLWGSEYAMLCRVASGDSADVIEPCIGRTFLWNEGAAQEVIVEEYYEEQVRSRILRVRHDTTEAFLASFDEDGTAKSEISKACGYLIDTNTAS